MIVGVCKIKMRASWVQSLKDKRMVVKSIIARVKNKFNVSIAEVEAMDIHQTIIIGISLISNSYDATQSTLDKLIDYIEENTQAELLDIEVEITTYNL